VTNMSTSIGGLQSDNIGLENQNENQSLRIFTLESENQGLQAIINLQDSASLNFCGAEEFNINYSQVIQFNYTVGYSGIVMFSEALICVQPTLPGYPLCPGSINGVPYTLPLQFCSYQEVKGFPNSSSYCGPQQAVSYDVDGTTLTVWVGWVSVAPGNVYLQAMGNSEYAGQLVEDALFVY
jgi:hypothetical protein